MTFGGVSRIKVVPCRVCGRTIWLVKDSNTLHHRPIDPVAQLDGPGNIVLIFLGLDRECIQLTKKDLADGQHRYTHLPHQATCRGRRPPVAA